MSGLYLLTVAGIWAGLTWLLFKTWQRLRDQAQARRRVVDALCLGVALVWICGSFWYGGGRNIFYDIQVDRMCRVDGGVKVYETAHLPAEQIDERGNSRLLSKDAARSADQYYYQRDYIHYRERDPQVTRVQHRIIRRSDGKVLGESIRYTRGGGGLPGPWHGSSYICPPVSKESPSLERSIFTRKSDR